MIARHLVQIAPGRSKWVDGPAPSAAQKICPHGGAEQGQAKCDTCSGTKLKTFACSQYGLCHLSPDKTAAGVHRCDAVGTPTATRHLVQIAPGRSKWADGPAPAADHQVVIGTGNVGASGIGDAMLGLLACAGLKRDDPRAEIVYVCKAWQIPWVRLFGGYDRLATAEGPAAKTHRLYACGVAGKERFAQTCGATATLPEVRPLPPEAVAWAEQFREAVVLAPWTLAPSDNRAWGLSHWLRLERIVIERGQRCVIIDGSGGSRGRNRPFVSPALVDESPARIAALMRAAACVVSNDSGMAHVAGALRVPCVVVLAQLRGTEIYGHWPTVRAIQGPLGCSGCHWTGPHYRPVACDKVCASLQAIRPEDVELAVRRQATLAPFVRHLAGKGAPVVAETGCQRADNDYGAGMFTTFIGDFLRRKGHGRLMSVDNDAGHVAYGRSRIDGMPVEIDQGDSVAWLRAHGWPKIDGLYLDSMDTTVPGFEEHCLAEARAALHALADDARILIDDTWRQGDGWVGKGAKAVPWLVSQGWHVEAQGYQTLLSRTS